MKYAAWIFPLVFWCRETRATLLRKRIHGKRGDKAGRKLSKTSKSSEGSHPEPDICEMADGRSKFPSWGFDNAQRLLNRTGVISEIPTSLCQANKGKNVILVIGDGMGWEAERSGAIAKQVVEELKDYGCDIVKGCPDNEIAKEAFANRTLHDYYTQGQGSGLPWQEFDGYALVTTSGVIAQGPNPGDYNLPTASLLAGSVTTHGTGMSALALDQCGYPIDFSPLDYEEDGGHMVLWNDTKGGMYPWDDGYYSVDNNNKPAFDPEYITRHAPDSAATATCMATGYKTGPYMLSLDLYEQQVSTILEDAIRCGKAGGVVTSVPILHATPAAFMSHSNNRLNRDQIRQGFRSVNPTIVSGVCYSRYYPFPQDLESMQTGALSSQWTFLHQQEGVLAEDFYTPVQELDPNNGDQILVCLGGDYSPSRRINLPYRGLDGDYANRWCSRGSKVRDPDTREYIGVIPTTSDTLCNHYTQEEVAQIPSIATNVEEGIKFLGKHGDGFFMLYEQGDIDLAEHDNHMDDTLGALLDMSDSVQVIVDWVMENGGWEKNALYVTGDHDHYLTLEENFPHALATMIIHGESHNITPKNNTALKAWEIAISAGRHKDHNKSKTEHIKDFTTWTEDDIDRVGHFWGPRGAGGNGWSYHTTRPMTLSYMGDDGCIEQLVGSGYQVMGREVQGREGKIDQLHLHACIMKNLFGL